MTHYRNLQTYLADRHVRAKNHPQMQAGYRTSFEDIVARRGGTEFTTPCGSNVNDFVPFYFSPSTKMAYTIHAGNVRLRGPDNIDHGLADMDDVAYLVVPPQTLLDSGRTCWFTDLACNSGIPPTYENRPERMEAHIDWALFDDYPRMGHIPEIEYEGVCRWQHDRDTPVEHQMRSKKRMAEFMVRDHLRMDEVSCIVMKSGTHTREVQAWVDDSGLELPVLVKLGCYF